MSKRTPAWELDFITPPVRQGQIVEVSYASDTTPGGAYIYRLTLDRSGPYGKLERAPFPEHDGFRFEPWNEEPKLDEGDWEPAPVTSDGELWQPGGFARLDLTDYGRLDRTFGRLGDLSWVRLGEGNPKRLDFAPIVYASEFPGATAHPDIEQLGCECGCGCEEAALVQDPNSGLWLCEPCRDYAVMPHGHDHVGEVVCARRTGREIDGKVVYRDQWDALHFCPFCPDDGEGGNGMYGPDPDPNVRECKCARWVRTPEGTKVSCVGFPWKGGWVSAPDLPRAKAKLDALIEGLEGATSYERSIELAREALGDEAMPAQAEHEPERPDRSADAFATWANRVDSACEKRFGVSLYDLEDAPWRDYFDDGCDPEEAVELAVEDGHIEGVEP